VAKPADYKYVFEIASSRRFRIAESDGKKIELKV
jgi:hypothetical protein